jgi:uncharacterized protein (TIGR04255 family)
MAMAPFKLNLDEEFPHLSRAPIVEAAIHWQVRAQKPLELGTLRSAFAEKLPDYRLCEPAHQTETAAAGRFMSDDKRHVVQLNRDGVIFSRMQPYQDWHQFAAAAKLVWQAFAASAAPVEIQRLGVRFINRFPTARPETLGDFLREPPTCPARLPLDEFLYQCTFSVPERPFGIRLIKVMLAAAPAERSGLFIDCDVFSKRPITCEERAVDDALSQMRWLKNKTFFTLLTDRAIESLK